MIDLTTFMTIPNATYEECAKVLHTRFRGNYPQFKSRFLIPLREFLTLHEIPHRESIIHIYDTLFSRTTPYSYIEAFGITNTNLRAAAFEAINVETMMKELGSTRIKTVGIDLINVKYIPELAKFSDSPMTQIYELHEINTAKLNLNEPAYAIKCWCTSTNKEHWLWIPSEFKDDILGAVASTCMIYEKMAGKIKHIIRQGDVFIFEMTEPVVLTDDDALMHMTSNEYFSLLKSQS